MNVFVVTREYPYEGSSVIGVGSTLEAAQHRAQQDLSSDDYMGEWYLVLEGLWSNQPRYQSDDAGNSYATHYYFHVQEFEVSTWTS